MGKNVVIGSDSIIISPRFFKVGDRVFFGTHLHAEANVSIGSDCLISSYVAFIGNDHKFDDPKTTVYHQGRNEDPVIILEGDNLIGFGAKIIGNVRIGRGAIIGAGSVVTKDVPANTIYAGVPAKFIRHRFNSENSSQK